jgi:hypothetical protein
VCRALPRDPSPVHCMHLWGLCAAWFQWGVHCGAADADRLQRLEIELLGASSTGYNPTAADEAAAAAAAAAVGAPARSSCSNGGAAPFALPARADFQWAWR